MSASIDTYRTVNLETASPHRVIVKLYEATIRNLEEAERALAAGEPSAEALGKARTLVGGLMSSLNFEAGEMSRNLLRLYLFAVDRIQSSAGTGRDAGLGQVVQVFRTLQSAWEEMPPEETRPGAVARRARGLDLKG